MSPLNDAKLRLEWAKNDISQFAEAIRAHFVQHPNVIVEDHESQPGRILHRVVISTPIPHQEWQRLITRILPNLRDPLDYATVAVAKALNAEKADLFALPIEDSEAAFEREMKKRKIEARCPQLAIFLRALKPYKGPNNLLFALHDISGPNKHRELSPVGMARGGALILGLQVVNSGSGPFKLGLGPWEPEKGGYVFLDRADDSEFNGHVKVSIEVALGKLQGFEAQPVTAVLMQIAEAVDNVLSQFERQFFSVRDSL